jgi:hypothetical protein
MTTDEPGQVLVVHEVPYTALLSVWPSGHTSEHRYEAGEAGEATARSSGGTWVDSGLIVSFTVERRTRRGPAPYPWCYQPDRCVATGHCEARWSCGD